MKKTLNTYCIYAIVTMNIGVDIKAESFEDALSRAQTLKETDFCKPLGEYNDGEIKISGIFDNKVKMPE